VACTLIVGLTEQRAEVLNATVDAKFLEVMCDLLPKGAARTACVAYFKLYGPHLIELFAEKHTPDVICTTLQLCDGTCRLFPAPTGGVQATAELARARLSGLAQAGLRFNDGDNLPAICNHPEIKPICDLINNFASNHEPIDDLDHDLFSPLPTLRGSDWRGKDCNDRDPHTRPGLFPVNGDAEADSNCNGISGVNPATGIPYETELCANTGALGTVVLGDSASAHFHIPPAFFMPATWGNHTFRNILPMCGCFGVLVFFSFS
jgi:acyloxyacyl hydrolase